MIAPEDIAYLESLLRSGKIDRARSEKILGELLARPEARLADVLAPGEAAGGDTLPLAARSLGPVGDAAPVIPGTPLPRPDAVTLKATAKVLRRIGKYDLHAEIGRGGMGVIYKATDNALKRTVAMKMLKSPDEGGQEHVERFIREARAAAGLSHPNIVGVHDVGEIDGTHFFTMDYIEGMPLDALLRDKGALPPRAALQIARDAAHALEHAHRKGLIHRDVKPGNILLQQALQDETPVVQLDSGFYRVLLTDFGLAKEVDGRSALTLSGNLIGTPAYMSPEQAAGRVSRIDARSDIYSLGSVLYQMLAGVQPFATHSAADLLSAIQNADPEPLRTLKPGIHRDIETIVQKAMSKEPERRYQTAAEFAEDLDRSINGEAIRAVPASLVYRLRRSARRHTAAWVAAAVCLAAAASAAGWAAWKARTDRLELTHKAADHVAEARRFLEIDDYDQALREFALALDLEPGHAEATAGRDDARFRRFRAGVKRMVDSKNWEGALSMLAAADEYRGRREIVELERAARGTATLEVRSAVAMEVDVVEAEDGVTWDEETFPSIGDARATGLARPVGMSPVNRMDVAPGDYFVAFSKGGELKRLVAVRVERGAAISLEYRVVRVGAGAEVTYKTVEDALRLASPGHVVELEAGEYAGGWVMATPGVAIRPVAGAAVVVIAPADRKAVSVSAGWGIRLEGLEFRGGRDTAVSLGTSARPEIVRCRFQDADRGGIWIGTGDDAVIRDCRLVRCLEQSIHVGGNRPLVLMNQIDDAGWGAIVLEGPGAQAVRNTIRGGQRIGVHGTRFPNLRILENTVSRCADWGIFVEKAPGSVISDNLCFDNAAVATSAGTGNIVTTLGDVEVRHNTTFGGGHGFLVHESNALPFSDNIASSHKGYGIALHAHNNRRCDYNLVWNCTVFGRFIEKDCPDLAAFQTAQQHLGLSQMENGLETDPRFADAPARDFRLASDSPARGAASDSSDIGARVEAIQADRVDSAGWIRRVNGKHYLEKGRLLLSSNRKPEALTAFKRAQVLLPKDAELPELIRRAGQ